MNELHQHSSEWNRILTPIVTAYLDPEVSARSFADLLGPELPRMRTIVSSIRVLANSVSDPELREPLSDIADNFSLKLDHLTQLHTAVATGDAVAEQAASAALSETAADGQALAMGLIDLLRSEYGMDVDSLMESLTASQANVGGPAAPSVGDNQNGARDFVSIADDTGRLHIDVPTEWSDIGGDPLEGSSPAVVASTNINAMMDGDASGVLFAALAGGQDHNAMLAEFGLDCAQTDREAYDDGLYQGVVEYGSGCPGQISDAVVVAAAPVEDDITVVVVILLITPNYEIIEQVFATFIHQ